MVVALPDRVAECVEVSDLLWSVGNTQVKVASWVRVHPFAFNLLESHFNILILVRINDSRFASLLSNNHLRNGVVQHFIMHS